MTDIIERIELFERISCPIRQQPVSKAELKQFEKALDALFKDLDIDVNFSRHFFDRLNDPRNGRQISICELEAIFQDVYKRFGVKLSKTQQDIERVIKSNSTMINIPVAIEYDKKNHSIQLVAKTVMRKHDFKTPTLKLVVESVDLLESSMPPAFIKTSERISGRRLIQTEFGRQWIDKKRIDSMLSDLEKEIRRLSKSVKPPEVVIEGLKRKQADWKKISDWWDDY